jgi:hypothetical protein
MKLFILQFNINILAPEIWVHEMGPKKENGDFVENSSDNFN